MYTALKKYLDRENLKYTVDNSKVMGQPRIKVNGYVIGSATEFPDQYTVYYNQKEVMNTPSVDDVYSLVKTKAS